MDGNGGYSFRLGRRSAQKVLDASPCARGALPRIGYEKVVREVQGTFQPADSIVVSRVAEIFLANVSGHYVLRCATLSSKYWPGDMFPKGVRLRPCDWNGNEQPNISGTQSSKPAGETSPRLEGGAIPPSSSPDVEVENHGTVFKFRARTEAAKQWVAENVQLEDWQLMGGGFVVDHRFAQPLVDGMQAAGLVVV